MFYFQFVSLGSNTLDMKLFKTFAAVAICALLAACGGDKPTPVNPNGNDDPKPPVNQTEYVPEAEMPILAWYSIPPAYATLERYQELKKAGFTINFSHIYTLEDAMQSLNLAQQAGIKVIFTCGDALNTDTENIVNQVKNHPAL